MEANGVDSMDSPSYDPTCKYVQFTTVLIVAVAEVTRVIVMFVRHYVILHPV